MIYNYFKLQDNKLIPAPHLMTIKDGENTITIPAFNQREEMLREHGYKPLKHVQTTYDTLTHKLGEMVYNETETDIEQSYTIVEITPEEKQSLITNQIKSIEYAVEAHINATAQARGYDDFVKLTTYVNSQVPLWKQDASTAIAWRDEVWGKCHYLLNQFMSGELSIITAEQVIEQLPLIKWEE